MKEDSSWHLDKKVPITLIVALVLQSGGFIWWGASISFQVEENKVDLLTINKDLVKHIDKDDEDEKQMDLQFRLIMEKLTRLETILESHRVIRD